MEEIVRRWAFAAVVPFLLLAVLVWVPAPAKAGWLLELFRCLSAAGLAALGGAWWGMVLAQPPATADRRTGSLLAIACITVLVAVLTLVLPAAHGLLLGASAYAVLRWLEVLPSHRALWPGWYHLLRGRLTWLAVLAHLSFYVWVTATWYHGSLPA